MPSKACMKKDSARSFLVAIAASFVFAGCFFFFRASGFFYVVFMSRYGISRKEAVSPVSIYHACINIVDFAQTYHKVLSLTVLYTFYEVFKGMTYNESVGPIAGYLNTVIRLRTLFIISGIVNSAAIIAMSFAQNIEQISIAAVFLGLSCSVPFNQCFYLVAGYFDRRRNVGNGILCLGPSVILFVLPPLLQFLYDQYGFQGCLLLCGAILMHVIPIGYCLKPFEENIVYNNTTENIEEIDNLLSQNSATILRQFIVTNVQIFTCPWFYVIACTMLSFSYGFSTFMSVTVDLVKDKGIENELAVISMSVYAAGDILGRITFGFVTDAKLVERRSFMGIIHLACAACWIWLSLTKDAWNVYLCLVCLGTVNGGTLIHFADLIIAFVGIKYLNMVHGWINLCNALMHFTRPFYIGFVRDQLQSYNYFIWAQAVVSVLVGTVWLSLRFVQRQQHGQGYQSPSDLKMVAEQHLSVSLSSLSIV